MRIKHFKGQKIHGYLNLDINFFSDVNFLIGINGSGKTSVVNGISALISPSLVDIAMTDYRRMEVGIESEGSDIVISARKFDGKVEITCNMTDVRLELPILSSDTFEFYSPPRAREELETFYREQEAKCFENEILKLIKELPTPMFLDIERRLDNFLERRPVSMASQRRKRNRNVFKLSLHKSLSEASDLAERSFRLIKARQDRLTDDFRKKIILSSIEFEDAWFTESGFPKLDLQFLEQKAKLKQTLEPLGLSRLDIDHSLDAFFAKLENLSSILPSSGDVAEFLENVTTVIQQRTGSEQTEAREKLKAYLDWTVIQPQYHRILKIKEHVDLYLANSQKLYEPVNRYLSTVNQFLNDSGKEIKFDETSNLLVTFSGAADQPITSLASGESQIVVILTHLFFNPDAKQTNVFIVDEPELSLHVRWQELFVESIKTADPDLQLILATHSPSIILEDIDHCIDISEGGNAQ